MLREMLLILLLFLRQDFNKISIWPNKTAKFTKNIYCPSRFIIGMYHILNVSINVQHYHSQSIIMLNVDTCIEYVEHMKNQPSWTINICLWQKLSLIIIQSSILQQASLVDVPAGQIHSACTNVGQKFLALLEITATHPEGLLCSRALSETF